MTPREYGPNGKVALGAPFNHGVLLAEYHADKIAKNKLSHIASDNNAVMSCPACAMTGVHCCGATRPMGYDEPVIGSTGKCLDMPMQMSVDNVLRLYTDAENIERQVVQAQANAM